VKQQFFNYPINDSFEKVTDVDKQLKKKEKKNLKHIILKREVPVSFFSFYENLMQEKKLFHFI
jgi:hypothetical protein